MVGVDAGVIRQLARDLAAAPSAAVYGRIGTTTAEFGTLTSWLVDLLNVLYRQPRPAGRRDVHPGGGRSGEHAGASRRSAGGFASDGTGAGCAVCPNPSGELPAVCMAEEIDTPGEGQIRAMITIAGNPAVSTPNAERLDAALAGSRVHGRRRHLRATRPPATPT